MSKKHTAILLLLAAALGGCSGLPKPSCIHEEARVSGLLHGGGFASQGWAAQRQWSDLMAYMQCRYPTASVEAGQVLESIAGIERVVQPKEVRALYPSREEWRQSMLRIAERSPDTRIERALAKEDEREKLRKQALELYERMWRQKKDYSAGHDIAFGLLHGWDGGKKDEHAARYWYAITYDNTGNEDSLKACQMLEAEMKKKSGSTLEFCAPKK